MWCGAYDVCGGTVVIHVVYVFVVHVEWCYGVCAGACGGVGVCSSACGGVDGDACGGVWAGCMWRCMWCMWYTHSMATH